jgi:SAM-dependent MidA family methyltransferase
VLRRAGFAGDVHLVETSPVLREVQAKAVPGAAWHDTVGGLPDAPLLLVANEFFDALPIRQIVEGVERRVTVAAGGLAFDRDGHLFEDSPARDVAAAALAATLEANGGVALVIDYGHAQSDLGETLQGMRKHKYAPVLASPGEQDLTAHVDFQALAKAATAAGAAVTEVVSQGEWLERLGIGARADGLARTNPDKAEDIQIALQRLTARGQMGELFKVMALHSPDWPRPEGFA